MCSLPSFIGGFLVFMAKRDEWISCVHYQALLWISDVQLYGQILCVHNLA